MSLQNLFNKKVNIIRITKTSDGMGGWTEVKNVLHNNLACRINWKSGTKRIYFDKDSYLRDGVLYCNVVDITTEDKVQFGAREYKIVSVDDTDELNKFLKLTLKLIE